MIRIPYVGNILRNTSAEIFCRVLGILYGSSGENIEAIQLAGEASGNRYLAYQIKTAVVPTMLKFGTATQLADFYQMENQYAMKNLVSFIELSITLMIMGALIFLTLLSSETASLRIKTM